MNWLKRFFGGEQKATPNTPVKPKDAIVVSATRVPAPSPVHEDPLILTLAPGVTLPLVRVPAGEFAMGSSNADSDAKDDEKPQHRVYLHEYLIGKTAVTVTQFHAFVEATSYRAYSKALPSGKDDHPVMMVSWDDAVAFCHWASKVTGRDVHLPTEAQWEKAARGTDGRVYPWGNEQPDSSRCNFDNKNGTTPVGLYSTSGDSPYGCADMAGNVWDWVNDWYQEDYYSVSPDSNPPGPTMGYYRVFRGGSWDDNAITLRSATRHLYVPYDRFNVLGFRCAVS